MKIDYNSSRIETNYFLIRAQIESIKTDYNQLKRITFNRF